MAIGILVIIVGIVVVGGVAIGVAMLFMGLLSGSSKPMPEPRSVEEEVDRKEILEKLARNEITKEEAEAALNAPVDADQDLPPPPAQGTNIGCIIGILAAVIIGILLVLGAVATLFLSNDSPRYAPQPPMPARIEIAPEVLEEVKEIEEVDSGMEPAEAAPTPTKKEEESKANDSSTPNAAEEK